MLPKPPECSNCPLFQTSTGFGYDRLGDKPVLADTDLSHVKLVVWLEALGNTEVAQGLAIVGDSRFVIEQWGFRAVPELQVMNERGEILYGNTLRCKPRKNGDRAYPIGEERMAAEQVCRQYDRLPNPTVPVLLCGEIAQRLFFRQELLEEDNADKKQGREIKGMQGRLGRVWQKEGRYFIFGPHPAYIMRQPQFIEHLHQVLRITLDVLNGTWKPLRFDISHDIPVQGSIGLDLEYTPETARISVQGLAW